MSNLFTNPGPRRPMLTRQRRGTAIVLVLFLLILMLVIGLAFLNSARNDIRAGRAVAKRANGDAAVQAAVDHIGRSIADDLLAYLTRQDTNPTDPELWRYYVTYPNSSRPWLSSTESRNASKTDSRPAWHQISKLAPYFVKSSDPRFDPTTRPAWIGGTQAAQPNNTRDESYQTIVFENYPYNDSDPNAAARVKYEETYATVGPEGRYDAKYIRLPIPDYEGLTWIAAIRVIDNSSLVNVNTATQVLPSNLTNHSSLLPVVAKTPADVDLYGMMCRYFISDTAKRADFKANWLPAFIQARGLTLNPDRAVDVSADPARLEAWDRFGSRLPQLWFQNAFAADAPPIFHSNDEAGIQLRNMGKLESLLNISPLRQSLISASTTLPSDAASGPFRYLTTWNSMLLTKDTLGRPRAMTPPYIDQLDGLAGPKQAFNPGNSDGKAPAGNPNAIPWFRVNPNNLVNLSSPANGFALRNIFLAALTDGADAETNPAIIHTAYEGSYNRARQAANALAANLLAYARPGDDPNDSSIDDTDGSKNTGRRYFGLEAQPFFCEAITIAALKDANNDGFVDTKDDAEKTPVRMAMFEVRNPFPATIDLSNFSVSIGLNDATRKPLKGTLGPGQAAIFYTHSSLKKYADSIAGVTAQLITWDLTDLGEGEMILYRTGLNSDIMVDRMRGPTPATYWPASPALPKSGETTIDVKKPGNWAVTATSLQRNSSNNVFYPAMKRLLSDGNTTRDEPARGGGAPNYVYENRFGNGVVVKADVTSAKFGIPANPTLLDPATSFDASTVPSNLGTQSKDASATLNGTDLLADIPAAEKPLTLPPPLQLPYKNNKLDSIGEIAKLPTICNTDQDTFSELLYARWAERLRVTDALFRRIPVFVPPPPPASQEPDPLIWFRTYARYHQRMAGYAFLRLTEFGRLSFPKVPVATMCLDAFDVSTYYTEQRSIAGRINVNTAPKTTLDALPYVGDAPSQGISLEVTGYRDQTLKNGAGASMPRASYMIRSAPALSIHTVSGYASIGELLTVRGLGSSNADQSTLGGLAIAASDCGDTKDLTELGYQAKRVGTTYKPDGLGTTGPLENTPDDAADDVEEETAIFNNINALLDVRSDAFTAYVYIRGMRYDSVEQKWVDEVRRKFAVTFDRTNVKKVGDFPRVLMFTEVPN